MSQPATPSSRCRLPLYNCGSRVPGSLQRGANAGLWYNKMVNRWPPGFKKKLGSEDKVEWMRTVLGSGRGAQPVGDPDRIYEATSRLESLVSSLGGILLRLRTNGRFVTGLGLPHPVENGFAWHHTLGVPYLPGSSVKGIARHWGQHWASVPPLDTGAMIDRIFGPEDGTHRAGSVIFFDALPVYPVRLEIDYMTPHYAEYYQDTTGKSPPADWYSPDPIPFLTVAPGQTFVFGLAPRIPDAGGDTRQVAGWLSEALTTVGAGAKSAVGYGLFSRA